MIRLHGVLIFICLFSACVSSYAQKGNKRDYINLSQKVDNFNFPMDSTAFYIPERILNPDKSNTNKISPINAYFSKMLYDFHEPLLYNYNDSAEIYRFTWLRTSNKPVLIKISKRGKKITLNFKSLSSNTRYLHSVMVSDTTLVLTQKQWNHFKKLINKAGFWNLMAKTKDIGADGSYWGLEGVTIDYYQCVLRWSPKNDKFSKCCRYLISLSNHNFEKSEIY